MRFARRLVCSILFIHVLLLECLLLNWARWLFTGESREFMLLEGLKEWADQ